MATITNERKQVRALPLLSILAILGNPWLQCGVVAICVIFAALLSISEWVFNPNVVEYSRSLPRRDSVDMAALLGSLALKPTFASSFAWWHTSWCPDVPFWRPLTIQMFWVEKHLFSLDRFDYWMWWSLVLHLACISLFGWFAYTLTQRRSVALLSVIVYAGWRFIPAFKLLGLSYTVPSHLALEVWKNQPDLCVECFLFAACIAALKSRWVVALTCATIAVCFKESGWMAFILPFVMLACLGKIKTIPAWVYMAGGMIIAVLVGLRASAGHDVFFGYHHFTNYYWTSRYSMAVGGVYATNFILFLPFWLLGNSVFIGLFLRKRVNAIIAWSVFSVLFMVSLIVQSRLYNLGLLDTFASYTDPIILRRLILPISIDIAVVMSLVALLIERKVWLKTAAIVLLCGLIAAVPYAMAAQTTEHVLHQTYAFQSIFIAIAIINWLEKHTDRWFSVARP